MAKAQIDLMAVGGSGTDHFQKLLGMGEYDAVSSTQTIPEGTDFIVIVPSWIASANLKVNALMSSPSIYEGEVYYLESVGDSVTIPFQYQDTKIENSTSVTWTSSTRISISRETSRAGVFCFYFANK